MSRKTFEERYGSKSNRASVINYSFIQDVKYPDPHTSDFSGSATCIHMIQSGSNAYRCSEDYHYCYGPNKCPYTYTPFRAYSMKTAIPVVEPVVPELPVIPLPVKEVQPEPPKPVVSHTTTVSKHPLYRKWSEYYRACYDPEHPKYPKFGGAGITLYEGWHDPQIFIDAFPEYRQGAYQRFVILRPYTPIEPGNLVLRSKNT